MSCFICTNEHSQIECPNCNNTICQECFHSLLTASNITSNCGNCNDKLGRSKIYNCNNCNKIFDRDFNACRNIFMKSMMC